MNYVWALPTAGQSAADLAVKADSTNIVNLVLDVTVLNPLLVWDIPGGKHTISIPLNL